MIGFLAASQRDNFDIAERYLDTRAKQGLDGAELAAHLAYILNRKLPTALNQISNQPEGSQPSVGSVSREPVGTITTSHGDVEIALERIDTGDAGKIWLFSRETVATVPRLYNEISATSDQAEVPEFLLNKYFGVMVFGWLMLFVGLPVAYFILSSFNRLISTSALAVVRRMRDLPPSFTVNLVPAPIRLLSLSLAIHWSISKLPLPLLSRHFWSSASVILALIACVWLFIWLTTKCEGYFQARFLRQNQYGAVSLLRPARTVINVIAAIVGLLIGLYSFGLNPMAAVAGLGVGGIAVALAAQKTLENVIAGASLIADRVLRVGDFLKMGDTQGTIEQIGLRSTQVRTLTRTLVSIPNGHMATITVENFSYRDSFGFRHVVAIHYDTTALDLAGALDEVRGLLQRDTRVCDSEAPRARFIGFGPFGFEVELFAYVSATNFPQFLQIQEDLLLQILSVFAARGVQPARPLPAFAAALPSGDRVRP